MMRDEYQPKDETILQQLPQSNIQNRTIDFIFNAARKICEKEEPVAEYTHQTGSMRAVEMAVPMVLKYMPKETKTLIDQLYKKLNDEIKKIDDNEKMDDPTKKQNKIKIEDDISKDILELCIITLTYSSVSQELKEIKVIGNLDKLIEKTRTPEPINLFFREKEEG